MLSSLDVAITAVCQLWQNGVILRRIMQTSLSIQLTYTARMIEQVSQGQSLDRCLEDGVPIDLRAGVKALSYHTMRHLGAAQAVASLLLQKTPPLSINALLWVGLSLLFVETNNPNKEKDQTDPQDQESLGNQDALESYAPSYKPFVLVSQAVEAAKKHAKTRSFAPLVNGVLRRFMREKEQLIKQAQKNNLSAQWNFQPWWVECLQQDWPQQWEKILRCAQVPAPMVLRVNARWSAPSQACEYLNKHGIVAKVIGSYALELEKPINVAQLPGFEKGWFSVQSAAAQLAAPLLLDASWVSQIAKNRPLRVLDACCAPGGKTAHLLEMLPPGAIEVLAVDSDKSRLEKVQQTLDRVGLMAQLRDADLSSDEAFKTGEMFDAILLDAPCSASGIVRRHPDIRWLRRQGDIAQLSSLQQKIQSVLWGRLNPGGRLLYSTCSLFKAEGAGQTEKFQLGHNSIKQIHAPGHILPLSLRDGVVNDNQGDQSAADYQAADGFYYALFEK